MARPAEKARAMLNKWTAMRNAEDPSFGGGGRRGRGAGPPLRASDCETLADAERGRGRLSKRISEAVSKIQNPALGERALRDLNDDINKMLRERLHWNRRIKELGGPDYTAIERQRQIEEGDDQRGAAYRYFGAAKELPGVPELLQKQREEEAARRRKVTPTAAAAELHRRIDPDYFGWRDEEDGVLLALEAEADEINQPFRKRKRRRIEGGDEEAGFDDLEDDDFDDYLAAPSQSEIEQHLLELKKKALMAKYAL